MIPSSEAIGQEQKGSYGYVSGNLPLRDLVSLVRILDIVVKIQVWLIALIQLAAVLCYLWDQDLPSDFAE